ncbi:MAG TPA: hypothetical protein VFP14_08080 [Novosphingobium sp.]|nr:hypothetical protein [Novosphingobium sp.]
MPLTARSPEAVALFDAALERYLERGGGSDEFARQALGHDDQFALAWLLLGMHQKTIGDEAGGAASMRRVAELAPVLSDREKSVLHTLHQIGGGPLDVAESAIATHFANWPDDRFILAQTVYFYAMRDWRPDRIARQTALYERLNCSWGEDWLLLGELAFAHGEGRDWDRAGDYADRALTGNPRNASAAHSYAHVLLETGQAERGAQWVADWLTAWEHPGASYQCHLTWHQALCELVTEDAAAAAAKLDGLIGSLPFGALTDGSALAWRLYIEGFDMRETGRRLTMVPDLGNQPFVVAHKAMSLALAGDRAGLDRLAETWPEHAGPHAPDTAALIGAIGAFADEDWAAAADALEQLAPTFHDFGGSYAQSEVYDDTLIAALAAAGRAAQAADRLQQRIALRNLPRDRRWLERIQTGL